MKFRTKTKKIDSPEEVREQGIIPPRVVRAEAVFSSDRLYRFQLELHLKRRPASWCMFLLLNPSTATAFQLDPTVRRTVGFAEDWGYEGVLIGNAFAYRSTKPGVLRKVADPTGQRNDQHLEFMAKKADLVVCGWGNNGLLYDRSSSVLRLLRELGVQPWALKTNEKTGQPTHPLYLSSDLMPSIPL